jgi:hypothetical protein
MTALRRFVRAAKFLYVVRAALPRYVVPLLAFGALPVPGQVDEVALVIRGSCPLAAAPSPGPCLLGCRETRGGVMSADRIIRGATVFAVARVGLIAAVPSY